MPPSKINFPKAFKILLNEVDDYQTPIVDLIKIQTNDPYKVLVATILSARTKDQVTSLAASRIFKKAPDFCGLRKLSKKRIEELIYPVGFYRNKAKFLFQLPEVIEKEFNGKIPDTIDELIKLPGVGRKTANLVVAVAFDKPAICVDTHVHRIMNIWNYINTDSPFETEMALRKKLPKKYWLDVNRVLVSFGQHLCRPVSPHCNKCPINKLCPRSF
ncbi:MAG: endonuclease III [Verrucomicrobiota bacterium]|nr:endonuclease III [Verrucomicrobiota bacterium]